MADIMLKLAKLERPPPQPPLLHLPPPAPSPPIPVATPTTPSPPTVSQSSPFNRLPKLEIPFFYGDDVLGWLFQANKFFTFDQVPTDQQITMAAFYMTSTALHWFQWMSMTNQLSTWELFTSRKELRFEPSAFVNHEAQLYKLCQ